MASLHKDPKSPNYSVRFRFEGRNVNRSLGTPVKSVAVGMCSRIKETLYLLQTARIEVPPGVDPVTFILSDGKALKKTVTRKSIGLNDLYATYLEKLPEGSKEGSTLEGEGIHLNHLKRHLGPGRKVQSISKADLQNYVTSRLKDIYRGEKIQPDTVKKELVTFRMLWNWGVEEGLLSGPSPTKQVVLPLTDEKPPFMTRAEIEAIIARGGLNIKQQKELWESLYLETAQVSQVLEHIRVKARYPFIYPMMVFVAHTSARRSEMIRSLIEDVDFNSKTVVLREKKKSRSKAMTYRRVDMSPLLYRVMRDWLENHPGGQHTFCQLRGYRKVTPVTIWQADHHLKQSTKKSEWCFITGFHVFRHSFASNLAAVGVDQRVIDEFMGHQSEEMRRRYRHLFPAQRRSAIESVFGAEEAASPLTKAG